MNKKDTSILEINIKKPTNRYDANKIIHNKLLEEIKQIDMVLPRLVIIGTNSGSYSMIFVKKDGSSGTSERFTDLISDVITDKLPLLLRLVKQESEISLEKIRKKTRRQARKFLESTFRKK